MHASHLAPGAELVLDLLDALGIVLLTQRRICRHRATAARVFVVVGGARAAVLTGQMAVYLSVGHTRLY